VARYNPRRIKINRTYRVEEIADIYGVHKRTVANWIKQGLTVCSPARPMLIDGKDLRDFLAARYQAAKRPCRPGQLFCVACKTPQFPSGNQAYLKPLTATVGDLQGECPDCHRVIHRRVSLPKIFCWQGQLTFRDSAMQGD
jgi:hypothetical protein